MCRAYVCVRNRVQTPWRPKSGQDYNTLVLCTRSNIVLASSRESVVVTSIEYSYTRDNNSYYSTAKLNVVIVDVDRIIITATS